MALRFMIILRSPMTKITILIDLNIKCSIIFKNENKQMKVWVGLNFKIIF